VTHCDVTRIRPKTLKDGIRIKVRKSDPLNINPEFFEMPSRSFLRAGCGGRGRGGDDHFSSRVGAGSNQRLKIELDHPRIHKNPN
jgi:hypothetical protein